MSYLSRSLNPMETLLKKVAAMAGVVAAGIGCFHLVAWWSGTMTYRGLHSITMKTNAALGLVLCGVPLVLLAGRRQGPLIRALTCLLPALALALGAATLAEHVFLVDLGIDQLLAQEPPGALAVTFPNRMGPPAACSLVLGGAAILLLARRRRGCWLVAQRLGILLCLVPLLGLIGYLYDSKGLYGVALYTGIAWPTTIALLSIGVGILCVRPGVGVTARIVSRDHGGAAIRRLLPAALVLPVFLGWLRLQGEWHGLYERYFGTSILVLSWIVIFSLLVYQNGKLVSKASEALQGQRRLLEQSEARLHAALDNLREGVAICNGAGEVLYLNPAIVSICGLAAPEEGNWTLQLLEQVFELRSLDGRALSSDQWPSSRIANGEAIRDLELLLRRPDQGWERVVSFSGGMLETAGGERLICLTLHDLTDQRMAEASQRQSEERFRVAQELSPDGFSILRPVRNAEGGVIDFTWLYENPAIGRLNGTDPERIVGRRLLELFPEHGNTVFHEAYRQVAVTGKPQVCEAPIQLAPATAPIWFRAAVVPIGSDIAVLAQDITEKKRAEEKLLLSEEKFAKAFAHNSAAMTINRIEDGRYIEVNEVWTAMFGYSREEALGKTSVELKIWQTTQERAAAISPLKATGTVHNVELKLRRRSGESVDTLCSAGTITLGGERVALWSVVDITDRKRAEQALREREEQLKLFIDHAPAALAMFDREMRYLNASRRWSQMYGLGDRDLRGASHYEVFPEITLAWRECHRRGLAGEILRAEADRFERMDGSVQWLRWEIRPWHDPAGEVGGIVIFAEDMTEAKRAEELLRRANDQLELRVRERTRELERTYEILHRETEERLIALENLRKNEQLLLQQSRLAAMGEMLGNIAHQWRQPLNNLGIILQYLPFSLEVGELDAESLSGAVTKAMQLILHMSHTIDDFRDFLQPEKEKREFDAREAVAATISLFEATLKAAEIDLQVKQTGELLIYGHRNGFCQVIMNLITNARDAFKERGIASPKLVIELGKEDGRSVVTVADNAGGIAEHIIDRIFDPFFTTKGPDKGTGIGLFMSKNIIEKSMNGSLTVRNKEDGAEFRIEV